MPEPVNRCRLVLCVPLPQTSDAQVLEALGGGDVSSVILFDEDDGEIEFIARCKSLVTSIQKMDVAVIVAYNTRAFGRSDADGILISGSDSEIKETIARFSPHKMVGCAGLRERHRALIIGEYDPEFVFFGKLNGDTHPEPHRKNLALGEWWAQLVEIPCIVMAGNTLASAIEVAQSGAEFVAMSDAIFKHEEGPGIAVKQVNKMLGEQAPRFE